MSSLDTLCEFQISNIQYNFDLFISVDMVIICSYTKPEVARRVLAGGYVMVENSKVAVKEMDGQPVIFRN